MGRFYKTTTTPTVDYSAEFPFQELFQAYKYQQDRSDQAYADLGLAWDELLKVGYIPGGGDEEYVKNKRQEFENLYRAATAKGNLASNYNWIQQQISLIGRDPNLVDIHRSYLGGNEKIKNDQVLKEKGQFKDYLSPNNYGWTTANDGIFGSQGSHFTKPWLEWKPTALSYFNDVPEATRTGKAGFQYLDMIAGNSAADFAATPEGNIAIDEHIAQGVYTEGLDPNDPGFRNEIAYRILRNQAEEVWNRGEVEQNINKNKNKNNTTGDDDFVNINQVMNPYEMLLRDIYYPKFGGLNPYTGTENVEMHNGAHLLPNDIDDLLGVEVTEQKDDNNNVIGLTRTINLGKDVYLNTSHLAGGVYYEYNRETGEYAPNTDLGQSSSYERERQAHDIALLDEFYNQGWVQEIINKFESEIDMDDIPEDTWVGKENHKLLLDLYNQYIEDEDTFAGNVKNRDRLALALAIKDIAKHKNLESARQLLIQNGIDPLMPEYYHLWEANKEFLDSKSSGDRVGNLVSKLQHNLSIIDGATVQFSVNNTDKNTFMTYGFNAEGEPENRIAVSGYVDLTENQLEEIFDQDAYWLNFGDWMDVLVKKTGLIEQIVDDGDDSIYRIPLYIPADISESRMRNFNQGKISSSEGSNEMIRERKKQLRGLVDFNVAGNYNQMEQTSMQNIGFNNARKIIADLPNLKDYYDNLVATVEQFQNPTLKAKALRDLDEIFKMTDAIYHGGGIMFEDGQVDWSKYKSWEQAEIKRTGYDTFDRLAQITAILGNKTWNHGTASIKEIEARYNATLGEYQVDKMDENGQVSTPDGTVYIDAGRPGYNIVTDVKAYKQQAEQELRVDKVTVNLISDQEGTPYNETDKSGDYSYVITNKNYTVGDKVYSPYVTRGTAKFFNAILGEFGGNIHITGAHRTQAYNDALAQKLGHTSPGYHVKAQALDIAPNKALLQFFAKFSPQELKAKFGLVRAPLEEGRGTANHHIHLEFIR